MISVEVSSPADWRGRVAVVSFSRIAQDNRVLRQCALLAEMGEPPLVVAYSETGDIVRHALCVWPVPKPSLTHRLWTAARQLPAHLGLQAARAGFWSEPRHRWALAALRRFRPGVVIANDWPALVVAARYKSESGALIHYDSHEFATREFDERAYWRLVYKPIVTRLEAAAIRSADSVSTVGPGLAAMLEAQYRLPERPAVILSAPERSPVTSDPVPSWPLRLLFHGHLLPGRGIEALIRSASAWRHDHRLIIRGKGAPAYIDALKAEASAVPEGRVRFEPAVAPQDVVAAAARDADVGVFLTPLETGQQHHTMPNKLFEYIAAGLAVVISPAADMSAVVRTYGVGVISRDASIAGAADAINGLARDQVTAFKAAARRAAVDLCWESEREKLRPVFDALIARAAR